ncbi:MAG: helix-turn-helix transcriptional regulator [Clostridium sp.]|nr:helix-turn-helix transcriptional regulator [Clostridium sp.]
MKVKIARIKKGISQGELCRQTGIGRGTLSKIENGDFECVRLKLLIKIAHALDSDVQTLFLNDND